MRLFYLTILSLISLISCKDNNSSFVYDPAVPYPLLNPGDFWMDKFDQRGLQNAIIHDDKIYCNTIDVGGDGNFLYCLNPRNGLVVWRGHVDAYATQPASFQGDKVIYCSFLGEISVFNNQGQIAWKAKFDHPYGGHWVDTANARLLVKTVYWKDVSAYDIKTGKLISNIQGDSLQRVIESKMKNEQFSKEHQYQFTRDDKIYKITGRPSKPDEVGKYTIEILK